MMMESTAEFQVCVTEQHSCQPESSRLVFTFNKLERLIHHYDILLQLQNMNIS